jgi:uncharacterized protein (DUF1015 family)
LRPASSEIDGTFLKARPRHRQSCGVNEIARNHFISYEREMNKAIAAVDRGEAQMACLLKPVRIEQVTEIALGGGVLPQKSTDFYPKLLSGETIFRIEGRIEEADGLGRE